MNKNNAFLFDNNSHLSGYNKDDIPKYTAYAALSYFTRLNSREFIYEKNDPVIMDYLKNIHCKDDKYIYQDKNICFEFNKLSNFLQDKKYKRILESYDRIKNFYNGTIVLNLKYRNTNIIVGYTYLPFETLHVVNEYIKNGVKMIMDWKNNLCMSEEEYIKLTGFKQLEVITNKTIEKNKKIINLLGLKFYLLFANELNDELNKLNDRLDKKFIKKITG